MKMVFVLVTSVFVSIFSMRCYADVMVYSNYTNQQIGETFRSIASKFGPPLPPDGLEVNAIYGHPDPCGCKALDPPPEVPSARAWVVVVKRGPCDFVQKVRNAQNAGYAMAIVHNNATGDLASMYANNDTGITIPSVFVSQRTGLLIKANYQYFNEVYIVVDDQSSFPFDINTDLLIPFAVVVAVCFITMTSFLICRCIRDRRRARRRRLPVSSLRRIPIEKFNKGSPYEMCAICLDDYIEGEKLRILPCSHAYHTKCIDVWLTRKRRVCPICKRKVLASDEPSIGGSETDTDSDNDERTPLVQPGNSQHRELWRTSSPSSSTAPISSLFWPLLHSFRNANSSSSGSNSNGSNTGGHSSGLSRGLPAPVFSINSVDDDTVSFSSAISYGGHQESDNDSRSWNPPSIRTEDDNTSSSQNAAGNNCEII